MPLRVASFDVFDTVLTRRVGDPDVVHRLVAERLVAAGAVDAPVRAFSTARRRAEPRVSQLQGRPATLESLYRDLCDALNLPRACAQAFVQAERDVEREVCVAVPGAAGLVAAARCQAGGGPVAFVSDTPHSEAFLVELLAREGLLLPGDAVYGSAARGASKSRGGLFTVVARDLGVRPDRFRHVGDNAHSDVASARAEGWSGERRAHAALNRYERLLEEHADATAGVTSWLAGACRLARLELGARGAGGPVASVAAGVAAPLLVGFALWLAATARQRGLRRLYFVARDGEAMLAVAGPLLAALVPEVDCRYLYGSRQAWALATGALSEDVLTDWVAPKADSTARTALARVGLTAEQAFTVTGSELVHPARCDRVLSPQRAAELAELLRHGALRGTLLGLAREQAEAAQAYVQQEGFGDDVPSALVDIGWRGHTARSFDTLVRQVGGRPVEHLFLGLYRGAGAVRRAPDAPRMTAWLFDLDEGRRPGVEPVPRMNVVAEMLCAGTEGRLLRYRKGDDGRVRPELASSHNQPVLDWGLATVREALALVAAQLVPRLDETALHVDLATPCWQLVRAFWRSPSTAEVRTWGSFPWEEETDPPYYPVAEPLRAVDVLRRLPGLGPAPVRHFNAWQAGSALQSRPPWRWALQAGDWRDRQGPRVLRLRRRLALRAAAVAPRRAWDVRRDG